MMAYPGAQILDITGPLEVFSRAGRWLFDEGLVPEPAYTVEIAGPRKGPVRTSSGLEILAGRTYREAGDADTLLITGGIGYRQAAEDPDLIESVRNAAGSAARVGSICTGALILARTGLLEGLPVTTHWAYCDELSRSSQNLSVDRDAIFVRNGNIYTSAGVTSGMDMALAMVEEDWGNAVSLAVAQQLVLFLKRPGGQSQFSRFLEAEATGNRRIREVQLWILKNLHKELAIGMLAEIASMSPRNFARCFVSETGLTPAKYIEKIRVEAARRLLEENRLPLKSVARKTGFRSEASFRRAFHRNMGVSPSDYRLRFAPA